MDVSVPDLGIAVSGVDASSSVVVDGFDPVALMQMLWAIEVTQIFQFVVLVLIVGLIFGLILTRGWHA